MSSQFSVGMMNQLGDSLEAAGYTSEDVTMLRSDVERLRMVKKVLDGEARITLVGEEEPVESKPPKDAPPPIQLIADLDADPFLPKGWKGVEEHRKGGQFEYDDPAKVALYLSERQKGGVIKGHDLRQELQNRPVFNANLLDWYLKHPEHIPEEWKGKAVFFWGTIYRDSGGRLVVRYLVWYGDQWRWFCDWLDHGFDDNYPAAVPASA